MVPFFGSRLCTTLSSTADITSQPRVCSVLPGCSDAGIHHQGIGWRVCSVHAVPSRLGALRMRVSTISRDRKSTRLNSSHSQISYAVFCLKKKKTHTDINYRKDRAIDGARPNLAVIERLVG